MTVSFLIQMLLFVFFHSRPAEEKKINSADEQKNLIRRKLDFFSGPGFFGRIGRNRFSAETVATIFFRNPASFVLLSLDDFDFSLESIFLVTTSRLDWMGGCCECLWVGKLRLMAKHERYFWMYRFVTCTILFKLNVVQFRIFWNGALEWCNI